jgi:hypothetical protein
MNVDMRSTLRAAAHGCLRPPLPPHLTRTPPAPHHSRPPEPTEAARQNARAAHWLLAGLLASLAAVVTRGMDADGKAAFAGVAALGLLLLGAGVSVLVTALLAATASGTGWSCACVCLDVGCGADVGNVCMDGMTGHVCTPTMDACTHARAHARIANNLLITTTTTTHQPPQCGAPSARGNSRW